MHVDSAHWIIVTNISCSHQNDIVVYDSRFIGLSLKTKLQICSLVRNVHLKSICFNIANIQLQNDSCSCGLFAIAVATELVCGFDTCISHWHASVMRQHLHNASKQGLSILFPKKIGEQKGKRYFEFSKTRFGVNAMRSMILTEG